MKLKIILSWQINAPNKQELLKLRVIKLLKLLVGKCIVLLTSTRVRRTASVIQVIIHKVLINKYSYAVLLGKTS